MLEHVILKFSTEFVETNQILHANQHGFRSGLSTVTQLIEIAHDLAQALNQSQIDMLFLYFSKAFERVSHAKLIFKDNNLHQARRQGMNAGPGTAKTKFGKNAGITLSVHGVETIFQVNDLKKYYNQAMAECGYTTAN